MFAPVIRAPPMARASPPHPELLSPSYPYAGYAGASLRPGAALPMGMGMGMPPAAHDWQLPSMVPPQVAAALSPSSPLAYRSPRPGGRVQHLYLYLLDLYLLVLERNCLVYGFALLHLGHAPAQQHKEGFALINDSETTRSL